MNNKHSVFLNKRLPCPTTIINIEIYANKKSREWCTVNQYQSQILSLLLAEFYTRCFCFENEN